ncbi:response regulator [Salinarimonas rosea]|uniref:response regulator n=1 Tax=Salinarimonas rosea TaxID=552063 RepID=UPI00040C56AD|nr:response regulator [Salinarimonas rosea]
MVLDNVPKAAEERLTVLLAEDEPIIRFSVAETFRERGAQVIECATADEALDVVLAGTPLDALVTDVRMPGDLNGLTLAHRVKRSRPGMPVVVMSGDARPEEAWVADAFLCKPVAEESLCAVVERLVAESRSNG